MKLHPNGAGTLLPGNTQVKQKIQPEPKQPLTVTLSPESSELVRWYCTVTHHDSDDAIDGALHEAIESARAAYEGNGDDSFDILLGEVLDAQQRQFGRPRSGGKDAICPLGLQAARELARVCKERNVRPECYLQAIVEQFLADSTTDKSLIDCAAREARHIARKGSVASHFWNGAGEEAA